MDEQTLKEVEQLHAELAEKDSEINSLMDLLAEKACENKALRGQLSIKQIDATYDSNCP